MFSIDPKQLQATLLAVIGFLEKMAALTPTEADNKIVAWLKALVSSDMFTSIVNLISIILATQSAHAAAGGAKPNFHAVASQALSEMAAKEA